MPAPPSSPPESALARVGAWARGHGSRALSDLRGGILVVRDGELVLEGQTSALRRFVHGVALPFGLLRLIAHDRPLRRAYLRGVLPAALLTLSVGVVLTVVLSDGGDGVAGHHLRRAHRLAFASELYATLGAVEWCLLALTRDHQDQLARRVALDTGAPPDDPEATPRVRIDVGWLWRKLRRRVTGLLIFALGAVPFSPLGHLGLSALPAAVWGVYWASVFTLGRSRRAWDHGLSGDPWFLRVEQLLGRFGFLVRWFLPRLYFRLLRRVTRSVLPATLALERALAEGLGLGLSRVLCSMPVVYLVTRPLFPVAASHALGPHLAAPGKPVPKAERME